MKTAYIYLMSRFAVITSMLVLLVVFLMSYFMFADWVSHLSLTWVWALFALTCGLLAQVYYKLLDVKTIDGATRSEINRLTDTVNKRTKAVLHLIFLDIVLVVLFTTAISSSHFVVFKALAVSSLPLSLAHLLYAYLSIDEIKDFQSLLKKRSLDRESYQSAIDSLSG